MTLMARGQRTDQLEIWLGYAERSLTAGLDDEARRWVHRLDGLVVRLTVRQRKRITVVRALLAQRGGV